MLFRSLLIYAQLALGATMRHQHRDLSILDFPTAYGQWLPDTSAEKINAINAWRDARALSDVTAGPIDAALSTNSHFLYTNDSGGHDISAFQVASDGHLSPLPAITGLPASAVGLAAV